jgi:hypothetical protein
MQRQQPIGWPMRRFYVAALVASAALAGCAKPPEGEPPQAFCGFLYTCGSDSEPNQGGGQTATGTSNDGSGNSTTTGETTGD